jgi:hypothetical protein
MQMTRKLLSTREGTFGFAALAGMLAIGLLLVFMRAPSRSRCSWPQTPSPRASPAT